MCLREDFHWLNFLQLAVVHNFASSLASLTELLHVKSDVDMLSRPDLIGVVLNNAVLDLIIGSQLVQTIECL